MPIPAGVATRVGCCMVKESYNCFKPHFDYVNNVDDNFDKLVEESNALAAKRKDTEDELHSRKKTTVTTDECKNLLVEVRKTEEKSVKFRKKHRETAKCFFDMCPPYKLWKLGRDIVKTTDEVVKRRNELEKLSPGKLVKERQCPMESYQGTEIVELDSLKNNAQELMKLLKQEEVKRVGIWGMEGIGKTTLLRKLKSEAVKNGRFEGVVMLSVESESNVSKLREDLSEQLKKYTDSTHSFVDVDIFERLKEKRFLVLLDQVSYHINLEHIGISESHNWKFVIASTEKPVCQSMLADEVFRVCQVPEHDMLALFFQAVGPVVDRVPRLKDVAKLIVHEIGGMPRLAKAVGTSLRGQYSEDKWYDKCRTLQKITETRQGHLQDLHEIYHTVIDKLAEGKTCLMYVSLFPKDYEIFEDHLVECWRVESFMPEDLEGGPSNTIQQPFRAAREKGGAILEDLIDASLLERNLEKKHIKMPNSVRKHALIVLEKENERILLPDAHCQRDKYPPTVAWEDAKRISLGFTKSESLPEKPRCSKLLTLLLQRNDHLKTIPNTFFDHMSNLHLLDLFHSSVQSLPTSMFSLIKLRGLYLNHCTCLAILPAKIAKLKNLEVLDIRNTGIRSLPPEIGKLEKLKIFRVSFLFNSPIYPPNTSNVSILRFWKPKRNTVMIPENVVKKLQQLEELTIFVDHKERSWNDIVENVVNEMATLKVLAILCFYFPDEKRLQLFVKNSASWKNMGTRRDKIILRAFKMIVGCHEEEEPDKSHSSISSLERLLRFSAGRGELSAEIKEVLGQASSFELIGHYDVQSLSDIGSSSLNYLEKCVLRECNEMVSIIKDHPVSDGIVLPALKEFEIIKLNKLNCIWKGPVVKGSFPYLSSLTLNSCPVLTTVLSCGVAQQLQQLKRLKVTSCSQVREIIEVEARSLVTDIVEVDVHDDPVGNLSKALPKLEVLQLIDLPYLVSIHEGNELEWSSLENIEINNCPRLTNLSLTTTNAPELVQVLCSEDWWATWQRKQNDEIISQRLKSLCCFNEKESPPTTNLTPPVGSSQLNGSVNQPNGGHASTSKLTADEGKASVPEPAH